MNIGSRIKKLRKMEMLTQQEFAERVGIKRAYISQLESDKYNPSDMLVLSICRAFGVRIDWLKSGTGDMYENAPLSEKGHRLLDVIGRKLVSKDNPLPFRVIAKVLGIDPKDPQKSFSFAGDFYGALCFLIRVFEEGNKSKIDAVMAQLMAFTPGKELPPAMTVQKKRKAGNDGA